MPVLMLTKRLGDAYAPRQKLRPAPSRPSAGALGDWGALSFVTEAGEYVLLASQRTMLCVLAPLEPLEMLVARLRAGLRAELQRLGIRDEIIRREDTALADLALGKHTDRSFLGSMNDLAGHVCFFVERAHDEGRQPVLEEVQAELNETPHVKREPCLPDLAVRQILG